MAYQNDFKKHLLIDLHELLVPLLNISCLLTGVGIVVIGGRRVGSMVGAPFNDFVQYSFVDLRKRLAKRPKSRVCCTNVGDRDRFGKGLLPNIFHHVLDED